MISKEQSNFLLLLSGIKDLIEDYKSNLDHTGIMFYSDADQDYYKGHDSAYSNVIDDLERLVNKINK